MKSTDSDIDALFQLPPGEFTAARNALASRLKKGGHADEAEAVKALPKPSVSAWAVNQLFWKHRKPFDRLMAAGVEGDAAGFHPCHAVAFEHRVQNLRRRPDAFEQSL